VNTWTETLDAFESRIVEQRRALDRGEAGELAPFRPPADLGPMTADIKARATALLAEARDLVLELEGNVQALSVDLQVARTVGASTAPAQHAKFVDVSA
jgi:hypothetical protein